MVISTFGTRKTWAGLLTAISVTLLASPAFSQEGVWTKVFNGKDITGLKKHGNSTVTFITTDSLIEASGSNGYLYTEKDYTHYRARVEWKNIGGGNAGYLHHIDLNKHDCGDWPSGPELQMMQGDVGSIWTTDCKFNSTGSGTNFSETGGALTGFGQYGCGGRSHLVRPTNKEKTGEWNTWEIFVNGDSLEVKVNGTVEMRFSKLTMGGNVAMTKGKMGLQIEGSKVQWKHWEVMDLTITVGIVAKKQVQSILHVQYGAFHLRSDGRFIFDFTRQNSGIRILDASGRNLSPKL
jgi:hypothetical protein